MISTRDLPNSQSVSQVTRLPCPPVEPLMRANHHAVIFAAGLLAASLWVSAARASDLTVTATTGQVTVIEHGRSSAPSVGAKLTLPVEIHTGADGALDLQQLGSALHVGPN